MCEPINCDLIDTKGIEDEPIEIPPEVTDEVQDS